MVQALLVSALVASVSANVDTSMGPPASTNRAVAVTGWVLDNLCVDWSTTDRDWKAPDGTLPTVNPSKHTVWCNLIGSCVKSGFTVLEAAAKPETGSTDSTKLYYNKAYTFDSDTDAEIVKVLTVAKGVDKDQGFKALVVGFVDDSVSTTGGIVPTIIEHQRVIQVVSSAASEEHDVVTYGDILLVFKKGKSRDISAECPNLGGSGSALLGSGSALSGPGSGSGSGSMSLFCTCFDAAESETEATPCFGDELIAAVEIKTKSAPTGSTTDEPATTSEEPATATTSTPEGQTEVKLLSMIAKISPDIGAALLLLSDVDRKVKLAELAVLIVNAGGPTDITAEDINSVLLSLKSASQLRRRATGDVYTIEIVFKSTVSAASITAAIDAYNVAVNDSTMKPIVINIDGNSFTWTPDELSTQGTKTITVPPPSAAAAAAASAAAAAALTVVAMLL